MGKIPISKTEKNFGAEYEVVCFYTAMIYIFEILRGRSMIQSVCIVYALTLDF